jgi:hypothetical protein
MKPNQINEYVQTVAAVFAIAGILLLGYELRQSNRIAISEDASVSWGHWINTSTAWIESDIASVRAKSMQNPDALSLEEKIDLDWYLQSWVSLYLHNFATTYDLGIDSEAELRTMLEEVSQEAPQVLGGRWARGWLEENEFWIYPPVLEAIQRGLKDAPIGSDRDYYDRIDALAAALQ